VYAVAKLRINALAFLLRILDKGFIVKPFGFLKNGSGYVNFVVKRKHTNNLAASISNGCQADCQQHAPEPTAPTIRPATDVDADAAARSKTLPATLRTQSTT
jgi:hypothetical protein